MDIDPKTYPSRMFVRFMAHNQLLADATGRPITAFIKRLGGQSFSQKAQPHSEPSFLSVEESGGGTSGLSLRMPSLPADLGSVPEDGDRSLASSDAADFSLEGSEPAIRIDETLFEEIVKTTLSPNRFPDLYRSCGTQTAAMELEAEVATVIVSAYRQIKLQQNSLIVQDLNKLL